ncbi:hypothetical protein A1OE_1534 [Candidatus Endolissoclinum faulkneri L2]|uniref:Uncharacterized protein n=1 Tax=Candidatus Endolissoclinum faulkneri L2 TaxID=1193729 RepID=K7YQ57_9PROT|nr:hypothetical protein A1OE_1534 [Candidatus Endolissoclinum faulkneri L2]
MVLLIIISVKISLFLNIAKCCYLVYKKNAVKITSIDYKYDYLFLMK